MPKPKTTVKKTPQPQDNHCKCYISSKNAGELDGSVQGTGESFWINKLSDTTGEVRNNCLCGLCVGDIIRFKSYEDDGEHHPREFVEVIERKAELYGFAYTFDGFDKTNSKLPKNIQEFIWELDKKGCQFEGVVMGVATLSRPNAMTEDDFFKLINSGPMTFTILLEDAED